MTGVYMNALSVSIKKLDTVSDVYSVLALIFYKLHRIRFFMHFVSG